MPGEYIEKLQDFARTVGGSFSYDKQPTSTLRGKGWSRAEITIPDGSRQIHYIAFSGTNTAEVYSGFYAACKLSPGIFCRITEKDGFSRLVSSFSSYNMRSGRPEFDKRLHSACNNKDFLVKLARDHESARFLINAIKRPLRFEVMTNEKGLLHGIKGSAMVISLNTNDWIVDHERLTYLLTGFRQLTDHIG